MTSSNPQPRYARRFLFLGLAIAAAVAGYSYAWSYGADIVVREAQAAVAAVNRDGRRASCEQPEATGFPFRIGITCRRVMYEDARAGVGVRTQGFRSAAQIYDWSRIVAELDGPALVEFPGVNALSVNWRLLQSSLRAGEPVPERISVAADDLAVALDARGDNDQPLFTAARAELHARPNGDDVDVALMLRDLATAVQAEGSQPLQASADLALAGVARDIAARSRPQPRSGTIRSAEIGFGEEAGLSFAGPFSISEDGLLDAELDITVRNAQRLSELLAQAFPQDAGRITTSLAGIAALGDGATLPLTVRRGEASLGFIALGSIPPLF